MSAEERLALPGLMQDDFQLTLQHVLGRMRTFPQAGSVATLSAGELARASFGDCVERIDRLARALETLGVGRGDRVATFAFNTQRHFECYFAIPCTGAVLHTVNPRLFVEQIVYVINHAADRVVIVDDLLVHLLAPIAHRLETVEHFVVMGDGEAAGLPNALRYEELLAAADPGPPEYPALDEREAAALCYTSGTTGNPKGVLYSHRASTLHAAGVLMAGSLGIGPSDRVLVVVPMFHVNAWGLPYAAALAGCELVMPGRHLDAAIAGGADRTRALHRDGMCADDLRGPAAACRPLPRGPELAAHGDLRGRGDAARARPRLRGAPRCAHDAGVGNDGDEPDVHGRARGPAA